MKEAKPREGRKKTPSENPARSRRHASKPSPMLVGETRRGIILPMRAHRLAFAFFAAAILFSMLREWSAPSTCPRIAVYRTHLFRRGQ